MAQKTIVQFTDDLDGSEASQTVEFGYEGKTYKLDLNDKNAAELEEALAPYIAAAQQAGGGTTRGGGGRGVRPPRWRRRSSATRTAPRACRRTRRRSRTRPGTMSSAPWWV